MLVREVAADDLVLLGLDRRDDVAHRPGARPLDLGGEDARCGRLAVAVGQALVLVGREPTAVHPEPAAQVDAHRLGRGGAVVGRGDPRAPVDDHRVARGRRRRAGARCGTSRRRAPCGCRSGRRTTWCAGRPAGRRPGGRAPGRAGRWSTRRWPWRRRGGRPRRASGAAGRGRARGGPVRGRARRRMRVRVGGLGGAGGRRGHGGAASRGWVGSHTGEPTMVHPGGRRAAWPAAETAGMDRSTAPIQVVIDAADPAALSAFWASALADRGYAVPAPPGDFADWPAFLVANGVPEERWNDASAIEAEGHPRIFFQKRPRGQDRQEPRARRPRRRRRTLRAPRGAARARRRGGRAARRAGRDPRRGPHRPRRHWAVMRDPEGNEFCV